MNTLQIHNREAVAPGKRTWEQIEVSGEHRAMLGDELVVEVIDAAALASMVRNRLADMKTPNGEILVDKDHLSHDPAHSTEAMSWLHDVEIRDGQLWGDLEWTDLGADAIRNKRLCYFSTEYDAGDLEDLGTGPDGLRRVRPLRLAGLALTNRPNHRGGRKITNRKALPGWGAEQTQTKKPMNKTALEKLGLDESATEEQINTALDALLAKAAKADDMESEAEAETILNRHAKRIPAGTRDAWKMNLIANREDTEKLLAAMPEIVAPVTPPAAPQGRPAITNRAEAKTPAAEQAHGSNGNDDGRAAKIRNRASEIAKKQNISFNRAWDLAEAEFPR
jgi:hypothetical protein